MAAKRHSAREEISLSRKKERNYKNNTRDEIDSD